MIKLQKNLDWQMWEPSKKWDQIRGTHKYVIRKNVVKFG
jgi:hypothetical protein